MKNLFTYYIDMVGFEGVVILDKNKITPTKPMTLDTPCYCGFARKEGTDKIECIEVSWNTKANSRQISQEKAESLDPEIFKEVFGE